MRYGKYIRAVRTVWLKIQANLRCVHHKSALTSRVEHTGLLSSFAARDTVLS